MAHTAIKCPESRELGYFDGRYQFVNGLNLDFRTNG